MRLGWALAALLWGGSLLWPWLGWEGLRTVAPALSLIALVGAWFAITRGTPSAAAITVITAAAGAIVFTLRLLSPPANPTLNVWQSKDALAIGFVASIALLVLGALSWHRPRAGAEHAACPDPLVGVRALVVWRAVWSSRLLVWAAGTLGVLKLGIDPSVGTTPPIATPFGYLGNLLSAPTNAWDATAYLTISQYGYGHGPPFLAFFPLYPGLMRAAAFSPQANLIFGVAISLTAFAAALYLLARLVELECEREISELTVLLVAFSPMALFFSAVYTESLFLLLSVASFYCARRGCWARAGGLGALAAATRSTGVVLLVPLLIMYVWGPRGDQPTPGPTVTASLTRRRFPVRADVLWLILVPAGALSYFAYAGFNGDLLGPLHAQHAYWHRSLTPLLGAFRGIRDAIRSLHQLALGPGHRVLHTPSYQAGGQLSDPIRLAGADLTDATFLAFAVIATIGAFRRLPAAYGSYALGMIALTASSYTPFEPLASFPRYLLVVFPCQIWLAQWGSRASRRNATLLVSAGLMAFFASQFATWRWIA
ncbi:MAG: mannosyltransferase family protein [Solirubrobacteraceae bacterium]